MYSRSTYYKEVDTIDISHIALLHKPLIKTLQCTYFDHNRFLKMTLKPISYFRSRSRLHQIYHVHIGDLFTMLPVIMFKNMMSKLILRLTFVIFSFHFHDKQCTNTIKVVR